MKIKPGETRVPGVFTHSEYRISLKFEILGAHMVGNSRCTHGRHMGLEICLLQSFHFLSTFLVCWFTICLTFSLYST